MILKVLHIITGLGDGGAEAVLTRLILNTCDQVEHCVVSLSDLGRYGPVLQAAGIRVECVQMQPKRLQIGQIKKLWTLVKTVDPDVVQTWMYHADLLGGLIARCAGYPVIWGVRSATLKPEKFSLANTNMLRRVCSFLSYVVPKKIVCCSERAVAVHRKLGYAHRFVLIPNGYDFKTFFYHEEAGARLRKEWLNDAYEKLIGAATVRECSPKREESGSQARRLPQVMNEPTVLASSEHSLTVAALEPDFFDSQRMKERETPHDLIGLVGRYHPQKDHANFLAAMAELVHMHAMKIRCVLVGTDCDVHNADLMALITKLHLNEVVLCCGPRADIPAVMSALDLHVLSSRGESFPNVVAEAMACGTPCVVTDVGDAAFIVGDTGWVVESQHSTALAIAIRSALLEKTNEKAQWENRKSACVKRVRQHFSLEKMTASYVDVWRSVVNGGHTR